jgi:hypothetical protein
MFAPQLLLFAGRGVERTARQCGPGPEQADGQDVCGNADDCLADWGYMWL